MLCKVCQHEQLLKAICQGAEGFRMDEEEQDFPDEVAIEDESITKYQTVPETLEEVRFPKDVIEEAQQAWMSFTMASTKEAAGEALYSAIFMQPPACKVFTRFPGPLWP